MSVEAGVAAACRHQLDDRALRHAVLEVLRPWVPFDAHVWMLTDPVTTVGSSPHAQVPSFEALPRTIRLKYLCSRNRWTSLPSGTAASLASEPDASSRDRSWREFLNEYGIDDVASVAFHDAQGCWGFLELWRREGVFSGSELTKLSQALIPVTAALHQAQVAAFAAPPAEDTGTPDPAVLLLSPELDVRQQTPAADAYLRALLPTQDDRRPVPSAAYNVAAQLLAVESGVDEHPPVSRAWLRPGRLVTLRAARLEHAAGARDDTDVAVTIERCSSDDRLELFCLVHELSSRETDVLHCLAHGDDTRSVAGRLYISEFTVQDHLKSVFDKTGVRNRRALLARATG